MAKFRIYLVENDLKYARFLHQTLSQSADFDLVILSSGKDCLEILDKNPDLICIDFALTDMSYDELLLRIQAFDPNLSVLVFKIKDDVNLIIEILKLGDADYILRNENLPTLRDDYVTVVNGNNGLKDDVEHQGEPTLSTIHIEHFNANNADSKIEKELKAIIELAGVLHNENKIYSTGSNRLHHAPANFIVQSEKTLREYSIDVIVYYLNKYNQNVVKVAEKLDIGKSTIYNMIKSGEITLNK
jgi:DNA-binding NtrC family response regulator